MHIITLQQHLYAVCNDLIIIFFLTLSFPIVQDVPRRVKYQGTKYKDMYQVS